MLYKDVKKAKFEILAKMKGSELKGLIYVPLFPYYSEVIPANCWTLFSPS